MNRTYALAITLLSALWTAPASAALTPFTAEYEVNRGSLHIANTTFSLRATDSGGYVYQSVTRPVGLIALFRDDVITESSSFIVQGDGLRPVRFAYRHDGSDKNRGQTLEFDWSSGIAHSDYRGDRSVIKLAPGMLDRFLVQLALMRDLAVDELPAEYRAIDRGLVKTYKLLQTGAASVKTPAGTFETVVVQREDDGKALLFWCAPELGYLPVKMEQREPDKSTITMKLKRRPDTS